MDAIDLLLKHTSGITTCVSGGVAPRPRRGLFIKGPIPLNWVFKAGKLPGKALAIGMLLHFESGLNRSKIVRFRPQLAGRFGFHRDTAKRAIRQLQKAKLIQVTHTPGQCLTIELVDCCESSPTSPENCGPQQMQCALESWTG